jgi:hypothetical protein
MQHDKFVHNHLTRKALHYPVKHHEKNQSIQKLHFPIQTIKKKNYPTWLL